MADAERTISAKFIADTTSFDDKMEASVARAGAAKDAAESMSEGMDKASGGLTDMSKATERVADDAGSTADSLAAMTVAMDRESEASEESRKAGDKAVVSTKEQGKAARETKGEMNGFEDALMSNYFIIMEIVRLVGQFVSAMAQMSDAADNSQRAFTSLTGDAMIAASELDQLNKSAAAMDFGKQAIDNAVQHLMMLGESADKAKQEVLTVADGIAAMGGNAKQIEPVIDELHKIQGESHVTKADMDTLAKDGLASYQEMAKGMGISTDDAVKRVESGAITGRQAYSAMMRGMQQDTGAAEEQSKSFGAQWQRLSDEAEKIFAPWIKGLADILHGINEALDALSKLYQEPLDFGKAAQGFPNLYKGFSMGFASGGTDLPSGWRVVGEEGPELQWSPGGDTIVPNGVNPMDFLGGSSLPSVAVDSADTTPLQGSSVATSLTLQLYMDSRPIAEVIIPQIAPVMRAQLGVRR